MLDECSKDTQVIKAELSREPRSPGYKSRAFQLYPIILPIILPMGVISFTCLITFGLICVLDFFLCIYKQYTVSFL